MFKEAVKKALSYTGYTIARLKVKSHPQDEKQISARHFFDLYFSLIDPRDFFFVEIGANDGKFVDLLHEYIARRHLSGILVEPQRDVFANLKDNYKNFANVQLANVAIGAESGTKTFYTVKKDLKEREGFFTRMTGIASFDREVLKRTLKHELRKGGLTAEIPSFEKYIEETKVDTLSFSDFLERYQVKRVDFLQIDCEGYDYEIIKMIDFDRLAPRVINYESVLLSDEDREACEALLESKGYRIFRHRLDTCAFQVI